MCLSFVILHITPSITGIFWFLRDLICSLLGVRFFVGYGLELSRLIPLIIFHLKKKFMCITEDEVREAWAPGDLGFATRVPEDMLIVTIVLCYSVIAPLIIPFGVVYFGLGWLVLRNQVCFKNSYPPSKMGTKKNSSHSHYLLVWYLSKRSSHIFFWAPSHLSTRKMC